MDAEGARALARRIGNGRNRSLQQEPSHPSPDARGALARLRLHRRRRSSLTNLDKWTAPLADPAPAAPEPSVSIQRLPQQRQPSVRQYLEQRHAVAVEGRSAVVTEIVCHRRVGDRWESLVVDASIEFSP